ncbi:hypothetical protein L1987_07251 [Smallanthus sonchifolius]|uniref:Uncharacterized protein n=1 Tax=Smallanthus sonchifolius TaxID=185202 RepID=A0ACB9K058_9ASTR|nr:hypothetical protein L1987_07251 [Smallanthus sonchifolius]
METLETSETLIEGLVASNHVGIGNLIGGTVPGVPKLFDLGKEKCVDPCEVKGFDRVDSGSYGDVSIKGISLFVELTGGVTDKPDWDSVHDVGQREFGVNVGDLVWAIIKKQKQSSWWPGVVCDGSSAPKEVTNWPTREDDCLVRCFGNGSYVWCSACEVKPFVGYFERLPTQSKGKKFLDALDKAMVELGHRVKTKFTCSCFSKIKMEKDGGFSDLSVNRFEPAMFLVYIKDLARDISMPNKIDYAIKQSCLSAFYRSLGHLQIPMNQLKLTFGSPTKVKIEEENGLFNDAFEKSEKPFETRGRRKSRFLSYPGECGTDVNEGVDLNKSNGESQPVKKPRKKWSRKNKGVQADVCSYEVLSQLQFAAQDCLFPCESKNFDVVQRFISGFRKRAFINFSNEIPIEMPNHQTLQETLPKKVKRKDKSVISPTIRNDPTHGSLVIDFQNVGSLNLEAHSMANNRTEVPANQDPTFIFGDLPTTQQPPCKLVPIRRKKDAENTTSMHTWNADISALPTVNGCMEGLNQAPVFHFTNQFGSNPPCFTGNHGEPQMGLAPAGLVHVPKKRGRKRKNINLQVDPGSTIKEVGVPCIDLCYNKVQQDNVEVKGTAFLLKFSPDYPLPSIQDLNSIFSKYGALIECETQVLNESLSGQVVFLDSSGAGWAFWGLQNDKPFGPVLVSYKIQHVKPQVSLVPAGLCHVPNKGGRKRKNIDLQANPGSTIIPNLNENGTEKKREKGVKTKEVGVPCIDLSYNKVQQDNVEEVKGTAFLLKFSPDYPLPSVQDLSSVFSKYGALIESESQVLNENLSGQVVFLDSSSAGGAFWGLQNDKPFGPVLVNYKIQHLSGAESMVQFKTPLKSPTGLKPTDSQALIGSAMAPHLNTNSTEIQVVKRSKTIEEIRLPSMDNLSYTKVHQGNGEVTGTALLLKFSPYHPLPSSQDLNSVFCKYGELNVFETQVSGQNFTGQVVFVNPSTAGHAIQRLEIDRPFGHALLSYQVHHLYNVQPAIQVKKQVNTPLNLKPCQDLGGLKKNLEMMNSMLLKAGDSLSLEMRGKLESEIKGLMKKVSAMDASSSSSSYL